MAINRRNMVTRTIKSTSYTCMTVNTEDASVFEQEFTLAGDYDEKALTKIQKKYDTETNKIVSIKSHEVNEPLYGLPIETFMALATILTNEEETDD